MLSGEVGEMSSSTDGRANTSLRQADKPIWRPFSFDEANDDKLTTQQKNVCIEKNQTFSTILEDEPIDVSSEMLSEYNENEENLIRENWYRIRTHAHESRRLQDRYCVRFSHNVTIEELPIIVKAIFCRQTFKFKINMCLGFILENIISRQIVFYYASKNTKVIDKPVTIGTESDLSGMLNTMERIDFVDYCFRHRPNTRYVVRRITNVLFYVDKVKPFYIGCPVEMRAEVKALKSIICFDADKNGYPITDNYCFFRSLSYFLNGARCEEDVASLANRWRTYIDEDLTQEFKGVALDDLDELEELFEVNIDVYTIQTTESGTHYARKLRTSHKGLKKTLNLHLENRHFCFIKKVQTYCKCWQCRKCYKYFPKKSHHTRHEKICKNQTSYIFPGGGFGLPKTTFDLLHEDANIFIPQEHRYYPFRITYDFEAMFVKDGLEGKTGATAKIEPVSVSVCSNVPNFEQPQCFVVEGSYKELIFDMLNYMRSIATAAAEIMHTTFQIYIEQLEESLDTLEKGMETEDIVQRGPENDERCHTLRTYKSLQCKLEKWLNQIIVLGFNSGRFDMNLIRQYFFPAASELNETIYSFIKKGNEYMCISTLNFVFLDIKNYIAPTTSYAAWLKSSDVAEQKGFFPYEWLTSLEKLDQTSVVPHIEFHSKLKNANISDAEYESVKKMWNDNQCKTMKDFLILYNNLDVKPFVHAAEKMYQYWKSLKIDAFKGPGISLPGLALAHLMNTLPRHTVLPLFGEHHKDVYQLIRTNITGGLSFVTHRMHEKDVTKLPDGRLCSVIYSHDANSLYLYALAQPTGTGVYTLWKTEQVGEDALQYRQFLNEQSQCMWEQMTSRNMKMVFYQEPAYKFYKTELEWLEWMSNTLNDTIQHKFNGGQKVFSRSKKIRYPVDGYIAETRTVLQFHGCNFHGHFCDIDKVRNAERRHQTQSVTAYLRSIHVTVIEKWECEGNTEKRTNLEIQRFLTECVMLRKMPNHLTAQDMVKSVTNDSFFGMIECDIEVPVWNSQLLQYFAEFPPICKNVEVGRGDIGEFMREYAEKNGFLKKPRRCLISSYFGKQILLCTPLLQWYLKKGLVITRIYSAIQMKPKACFKHLADEVAYHRRQADKNPNHKAAGELWKLIGNNYYGKTITDKSKHKEWKIAHENDVGKLINDARFQEMNELDSETYEVCMDKKKIVFDLPISVAYFVYNYAKQRMLEFVYDFMKNYFTNGSYQIVCSDTDSIIAAYATKNIDELVKPEKRNEYYAAGKKQFLVEENDDGFSLRTPGLFKVELEATGIVAMCPKTYLAWDENDTNKVSCKGLSKKTNNFTKETFLNVLRTGVRGRGTNIGFKRYGNGLYQYKQVRDGLSYLYIKRRVCEDGIATEPLHL